jgi:predicted metalloprotease with PDZ domain
LGWSAFANHEVAPMRARGFGAAEDALIIVGKNLQGSNRTVSGKLFTLLAEGAWAFSDQEAIESLLKVVDLHREVGPLPCQQVTLVLSTFPAGAGGANTWSAETRGCKVTLLMGKTPSRVGGLAQLGNALTHETFHLWIPNGVALEGDYDWFYEGFTMYQAVRAAVRLGLVTWPEFLNAIARAHDGSMMTATTRPQSLIEASKERWTSGAATVYSKAMVVAFLYDLNLRNQTGGKRSLDDVYRRIMREHPRVSETRKVPADGNAASIAELRAELPAGNFIERFISAPVAIDLKKELAPFGLRVEKLVRTHVSVSDELNKRQRDLLKQLGYNEPRPRGQNRLR